MKKNLHIILVVICVLLLNISIGLAQNLHSFRGTVTVCNIEKPLENVDVVIRDAKTLAKIENGAQRTDRFGKFEFNNLRTGKYVVSFDAYGYRNIEQIEIDLGESCSDVEDVFCLMSSSITTYYEGTTSLLPQNALESPAAGVYVFDRDKIQRRGYETLLDLLTDVPEVNIHRNSIEETRDYYGIRGITGNEKILIFLDNVRFTASTGDLHAIGYNYPLIDVERVEVIAGPGSAVYGVDAYAGVVRIVTSQIGISKSGGCVPKPTKPFQVLSKTNISNFDLGSIRFAGNVLYHWKDLGISGALDVSRNAGFDFPSLYKKEFKFYTDTVLQQMLVKNPGGGLMQLPSSTPKVFRMPTNTYYLHLKAQLDNLEIGYGLTREEHSSSAGIRPDFTMYNESAILGTSIQTLYLNHVYKQTNKSIRSTISFNTFEGNKYGGFVNTYTGFQKAYKYQYAASRKIEEVFQWNIQQRGGLLEKSFIVAGGSYENIISIPKTGDLPHPYDGNKPAIEQDMYFIGTDTIDYQGHSLKLLQDIYTLRYQNYGGFVQFSKSLISAPSVGWVAGVRYDANTRYKGIKGAGSINPRIGLLYKPIEGLILKATYGESFLAPSPSKAYAQWGGFTTLSNSQGNITGLQSFFLHQPNDTLKPEKLHSFEVGASFTVPSDKKGSNTIFGFDAFFIKATNLIEILGSYDFQTVYKGWNVGLREIPVNKGEGIIKTHGGSFKYDGEYAFGKHKLSPYAYITYTSGNINGNDTLPYTPKFASNIGIDWTFKKIAISLRSNFRSRMFGVGTTFENQLYVSEPYQVFDLNFKFALTDKFSLTLRVNNLFDVRYGNIVFGGNTGFQATPQDPRFVMFGVIYNEIHD